MNKLFMVLKLTVINKKVGCTAWYTRYFYIKNLLSLLFWDRGLRL